MNQLEFLSILFYFSATSIISFLIGLALLTLITKNPRLILRLGKLETLSVSVLFGLGVLSYTGLFLGLIGFFNKSSIIGCILILLFLSLLRIKSSLILPKDFFSYKKILGLISWLKKPNNWPALILLGLSCYILITLYYTSMRPPFFGDELSYHLPEAKQIVQEQKINLNFDGHFFYGNLPKLIEVLFAMAIAVSGYNLPHAIHFLFLVCLCTFLLGFLSRYYNLTTGALTITLLLFYDELTSNSVVSYIDAATVTLELVALFLTLHWLKTKQNKLLIFSGGLIGLGLSAKYSVTATLIFIFGLILARLYKQKTALFSIQTIKLISLFGFPVFLFCGFWYIKNLVLYGNPTYPLYLGHQGVSEEEYASLVGAIQEFGPRNLYSFLTVPFKYFSLLNLPVFFSFFLAPLSLTLKKPSIHQPLIIYCLIYLVYWFLFATHQTRFLMPATISLFILTSIFLANTAKKYLVVSLGILILITIILNNSVKKIFDQYSLLTFTTQKFNLVERQYGRGKETKSHFLNRVFGCQFALLEKVEQENLPGNIIDNWTIWSDPNLSFYSNKNKFINFPFNLSQPKQELVSSLKRLNISSIYFKETTKSNFKLKPDFLAKKYYFQRIDTENYLITKSSLIFHQDNCYLYAINFNQI